MGEDRRGWGDRRTRPGKWGLGLQWQSQKQQEGTLIYFTSEPFHPNQTVVGTQLKHCRISDVKNRRTLWLRESSAFSGQAVKPAGPCSVCPGCWSWQRGWQVRGHAPSLGHQLVVWRPVQTDLRHWWGLEHWWKKRSLLVWTQNVVPAFKWTRGLTQNGVKRVSSNSILCFVVAQIISQPRTQTDPSLKEWEGQIW